MTEPTRPRAHDAVETAYLASLPEGHPDRRVAPDDEGTSAPAAAEGRRLGALLHAADGAPTPPTPDALARAEGAVLDAWDEGSAPWTPRELGWVAWAPLAAAAGLWVLLAVRHLDTAGGPARVAAAVGLAAVGLAALAVALGVARPRLGASTLLALLGTSAAVAAVLADWSGPQALVGVKCVVVEAGGALVPAVLLAGLQVWRRGRPGLLRFAVVAAAGALVAQSAVELGCASGGGALHALSMHGGGVLVGAALGALLAWALPTPPTAAVR